MITTFAASPVAAVGNTLLYPIIFVLYKLLVVLPNQIIYHILNLINWLTGSNLISVLTKKTDGSAGIATSVFNPQNQFFSIFLGVLLVGLVLFISAFIFGLLRAYFKRSANGEINRKKNMTEILKRSVGGIVIVIIIPFMFVVIASLVGYFFNLLYGIGSFSPKYQGSQENNAYAAFNDFILANARDINGRAITFSNQEKMTGLMTFNIWSAGFNISGIVDENNKQLTISQLINAKDTDAWYGNDLQNIASNVLHIMEGGSWTDNNSAMTIAYIGHWNIFVSVLCSLVMLYLIIMFVVSVLSRLLEVYFLVLISPIVIFGGIAIDKTQGKWIVKTFHKIITVNVAIMGYFFFNLIYLLLLSSFLGSSQAATIVILKFALLFAGMVLVNQIPKIFMQFLNSDEAVIGNEMREASMQMKTITAPLTTAMGTTFTGTLAMMRNNNQVASRQYQPLMTANSSPTSFKY